jgi:8-oxo-dGTP diphosphatase
VAKLTNKNNFVVVVKGVILSKGKALIIKRSNTVSFGKETWEFAGGKIQFGEDLDKSLVREIKEEVGIDIVVNKILYATTIKEPSRQLIILTYLCKSEDNHVVLSKEHSDYKWSTKDQLKELLPLNILKDFEKHNVFSSIELN